MKYLLRDKSRQREASHRGFTLLEVIIAMALFSTLMALLWSLFHTYTRLATRSRDASRELQIVRTVSRQLRSDIDHFAQLAIPPNVISASPIDAIENGDEAIDDSATATLSADQPEELGNENHDPTVQVSDNLQERVNHTIQASLPDQTYLKGSATKLEIVTRRPYTVDVPQVTELIGDETRYGTYQLTIYEYRNPKDLKTLLHEDPILNPQRQQQPEQVPNAFQQHHQPRRLNPNEQIGLTREVKSWLQVTRDRHREDMRRQAEASGQLVDGQWPPQQPRQRNLLEELQSKVRGSRTDETPGHTTAEAPPWTPPPELRPQRDHLPEITRLQFRFFDGEKWLLQWNGDQARLPQAVEIAFDVDPDAPAARAKEFETAHTRMVAGATLDEVLPKEQDAEAATFEDYQDPLKTLQLEDPTAIVTEYRFVIALPTARTEAVDGAIRHQPLLTETAQ